MTLPVSKKANHPKILRVFDLTAHAVVFLFLVLEERNKGRSTELMRPRSRETPCM